MQATRATPPQALSETAAVAGVEPDAPPLGGAVRAVVTRSTPPRVQARTRRGTRLEASLALPGYVPRVGDGVLLVRDEEGQCHVVGLLAGPRVAPPPRADGPAAPEAEAPDALRVERDPETGATVLHAPADLELRAEHGTLRLVAREIETTAGKARWQADSLELVVRNLSTLAERSTTIVGVLETRATRLLERAKVAYRDVEDLAQTRAGRIRQVAATTWQVVGKRALLRAEGDVKIRGEKIHLA